MSQDLARLGSTLVVKALVVVNPSKIRSVTRLVDVSLAVISLKDFGSEVVAKTSSPPYLSAKALGTG